ncbi:hypothetical protein DFH08DRAFT_798804 [Mycena albidolilacea]|uniref:Uncharacterized protein n=1 Tax=Mycena albidolilacea TaxID=1033008 RepID=A0AAD7F3Z0_9AGAR|nr:hypothetical protein DFH08DRAFT_798804 [Mycena albidolilacea]
MGGMSISKMNAGSVEPAIPENRGEFSEGLEASAGMILRDPERRARAVRDRRTGARWTMAEARVHETHTNMVWACGLAHNAETRRATQKVEGQNAQRRFQAGGHGHGHQLYFLPAKTIRGLPTQDDRSTRRARPPSPARRCGTRRINERGKWIPSVHIRIQRGQSRRRERVRAKLEKKRPRGEGRGAREAKPVKDKPLGEVHGRPRGMTKECDSTTRTLASLTVRLGAINSRPGAFRETTLMTVDQWAAAEATIKPGIQELYTGNMLPCCQSVPESCSKSPILSVTRCRQLVILARKFANRAG